MRGKLRITLRIRMSPSSLRQMRETAKLRQDDIADRLGLTKATISRIENGHQGISLIQAAEWARACGFTLAFLGPEHETLVRDIARLDVEHVELALRLVNLMPNLHTLRRLDLDNLITGWEKVAGSAANEIVKKTSRG